MWALAACSSFGVESAGQDATVAADSTDIAETTDDAVAVEIDGEPAELVRVVDGDSLEMVIDQQSVEVRLLDINAPELFGDDGETCNGVASRQALSDLVGGDLVSGDLVDGESLVAVGGETDRFGRRLVDLLLVDRADIDGAGVSVVRSMIQSGDGLATGEDADNRDLMKQAAAAGRGLWGNRCGGRSHPGLSIGETQVDPPGSDRDNLNEEWVTVVNEGPEPVDLTGWIIRDDTTGHRFELDREIPAGERLIIRSGSGSGSTSGQDFYLEESFPVWSNNGETVLLTSPSGVVETWSFIDP